MFTEKNKHLWISPFLIIYASVWTANNQSSFADLEYTIKNKTENSIRAKSLNLLAKKVEFNDPILWSHSYKASYSVNLCNICS